MYLQIAWLEDNWHVNRLKSLKLVTDISSKPGAMMTDIMWQWLLISCLFGWSRILRYWPTFQGLRIWIRGSLAFPSLSINRGKPLGWKWILFSSTRGLASKFFLLCFTAVTSSFFIRWRKEREKIEMEGMVVELSPFRRLVGAICQWLWWASHCTLFVVTGLRYQNR